MPKLQVENKQLDIMKSSWSTLKRSGKLNAFSIDFHRIFVEANPGRFELFKQDKSVQRARLLSMVTELVCESSLYYGHGTDSGTAIASSLAKKHKALSVNPDDFNTFLHCLLFALEKNLNDIWNDELRQAWEHSYNDFAEKIIKAMEETSNTDSQQ